ncbi:MAG: hypothetical protein F4X92_11800 [Gammaproteobacteria bacterium]|nr:hypothetical protein [Gammaproteobacteria bacterium]
MNHAVRLGNLYIPMQLHAGNRFEGSEAEVNGNAPFLQGDIRLLERDTCPDRKTGSAIGALVRHRFAALDGSGAGAPH